MTLMKKFAINFLSRNKSPSPFLITSDGQTGVLWLGAMLHMHPDILCSAGTEHPLLSLNYEYNDEELIKIRAGIKQGSDIPYGAHPFLQNILKQGGFFKYGNRHEVNKRRDLFPPLEDVPLRDNRYKTYIFDELKSLNLKKYQAYGNVRGLCVIDYVAEMKKGKAAFNGRGESIVVVDLIRHPILRLDSVINFCYSFYELDPATGKMMDDAMAGHEALLLTLEKNAGADFSNPLDRVFFYTEFITKHSQGWANSIKISPRIPRVLFEKLREDRDYFARLVKKITRGKVVADESYLDQVFSPENLASGRASDGKFLKTRKSAREIYESWPQWYQEQVRRIFKEHEIEKIYKPFGYDLSFLK